MAFAVQMFHMTKEVNSTKRPGAAETTFQCVSNSEFDIISPRLPLVVPAGANPTAYNYCRVQEFNDRYYWINNWSYEQGLWVAWCEVDALASWKAAIGSTRAYVLRSAYASDGRIPDHMYPTKSAPIVSDVTIPKDWSDSDLDYGDGRFIVGTIGSNGATTYAALTPAEFVQFSTAAFSDTLFNNVKDQTWMTKAIFDPMQYLSSVTWFPFDLTGASGRAQDIYLGYWFTGIRGLALQTTREYTHTVTLPKHPQRGSRGSFLDAAPYSNYILDLRPFGRIELKSDLLAGSSTITISYIVDWISGQAILRVFNSSGVPIAVQQAQLGVTVQISQVLRDYIGGALGMVGAGLQTGLSLVSGNIPGAIAGVSSAIGNAVNTMQPDVTTSGLNSGFSSLQGAWHLVGTFYELAAEDNAHRGRPLCQVRQLSTLPGYQICTDTDVSLPATRAEIDAIRGYLESGYYYE